MAKMFDRLLLFIYSFMVGISLLVLLCMTFGWIDYDLAENYLHNLYYEPMIAFPFIAGVSVLVLISVRLFYLSVRRTSGSQLSIDRQTEYGQVKISIDSIQSLVLQATGQIKGLSDVKTRIRVSEAGVEIDLKASVSGDTPIPQLAEELQKAIRTHVEEMTGITVTAVSVFIGNVAAVSASAPLFKSRVE